MQTRHSVWNSPVAALLYDFSFWKDRYGPSPLIFFLSPQAIVQGSDRREKSFSFFILLSAQPRSVKAVCRALNELIPYLWGSGTIYRSCNVIRGTGCRTGNRQVLGVANTRSFHHLTMFLFLLHPHLNSLQGDNAAVTGNGKNSLFFPVIKIAPKRADLL